MTTIYDDLGLVDDDIWAIGREPPPYDLNDNGSVLWPPECHFVLFPEEWPFVAEVWERYAFPEERTRIRARQRLVRCEKKVYVRPLREENFEPGRSPRRLRETRKCGVEFDLGDVRAHQAEAHPDETVPLSVVHPRWTYELLGFPEFWSGTPTGWRTVLDGRDERVGRWEFDALELGTWTADALGWNA